MPPKSLCNKLMKIDVSIDADWRLNQKSTNCLYWTSARHLRRLTLQEPIQVLLLDYLTKPKNTIHYESEFKTDLEEDYRHHHHHPHRTRHLHHNDKLHRQLIIVESVECRVLKTRKLEWATKGRAERQWRAALDSWELFEWRVRATPESPISKLKNYSKL